MKGVLQNVKNIFMGAFDQTALLPGVSDILIIKWENDYFASTPFLACFGSHPTSKQSLVKIFVNGMLINKVEFYLDKYGYAQPMRPSQQILKRLHLRYGRNIIKFQLQDHHFLEAQVYLYGENDKLLVSDVDGTMTKNDIGGLMNNVKNVNYLHDGYYELLDKINKNGYKIVWLTMRSLPLYKFSKEYIQEHTKTHGILLTEPEQFFPAIKKQILKQTGNIKTNMMRQLFSLFPKNKQSPFTGGLGNRENDAIAYRAVGIPKQKIFIIDTKSQVHNLGDSKLVLTYHKMCEEIQKYFPFYGSQTNKINFELVSNQPMRIFKKKKQIMTDKSSQIVIEDDDAQKNEKFVKTASTNDDHEDKQETVFFSKNKNI